MDKIEKKKRKFIQTIIIHNFYCDNCNKFIKSIEEYNDGYVPTYDIDYKLRFNLSGKGFRMNKHLCDKCAKEQDLKIEEELLALGFEKEGEN